jgi:hypothetical protein
MAPLVDELKSQNFFLPLLASGDDENEPSRVAFRVKSTGMAVVKALSDEQL